MTRARNVRPVYTSEENAAWEAFCARRAREDGIFPSAKIDFVSGYRIAKETYSGKGAMSDSLRNRVVELTAERVDAQQQLGVLLDTLADAIQQAGDILPKRVAKK